MFPEKISYLKQPVPPKFHTFEMQEANGDQSFFHCLIFFEELDEYQISQNIDHEGPLLDLKISRKRRQMERGKK